MTLGGSGRTSSASFAEWDRDSSSWRTSGTYSVWPGDQRWVRYSGDWPTQGTMRNGICSQRATSELRIAASAYSSGQSGERWPTPTVDGMSGRSLRMRPTEASYRPLGMHSQTLERMVANRATWPTPTATDGTRNGESVRSGVPQSVLDSPTPVAGHNLGLSHAARLWPTPNASPAGNDVGLRKSGDGRTTPNKLGWAVGDEEAPAPGRLWPDDPARRLWKTPQASDDRHRGKLTDESVQRRIAIGKQVNLSQQAGGALAPTWVEWLMGFPLGWTDPTVDDAELEPWGWETDPAEVGRTSRLTTDPTLRKERLKALGNAVVPACAELIGRELMARWEASQESD
jgi:site-specific DNA-cytosine methylase